MPDRANGCEMGIAYIISAYKLPDQLLRLISRLNSPGSVFLVHIDRKTNPITFDKVVRELGTFGNVIFLKSHKCYWGDFGHVQATIKGIRELFRRKTAFDYVFLLTGQDYPIKPAERICQFLEENKGKEFIAFRTLPISELGLQDGGFSRIERWHLRIFGRHVRIPTEARHLTIGERIIVRILSLLFAKRSFPPGFQPYFGSSYWCITRECAGYINEFVARNRGFVRFFKHVLVPDEMFFQTIIINSSFRDRVVNDNLRSIDWSEGGNNPRVWRKEDLETLRLSNALIARKFDLNVDPEILDLIDVELLHIPRRDFIT